MSNEPLAYRMRPKSLAEIVGQQHIIGEGKFLQRLVSADRLRSIILHGPPGTGKTTIAHVIARMTDLPFHEINAVSAGKKDMETIVGHARFEGQSILFVDEVHRFNKAQQDFLLPYIENGLLILIGATTENPHFEINHAIKSRCTILELKYPTTVEIKAVLEKALKDEQRGLGTYQVKIDDDTLQFLAEYSGGDVRSALNGLELAVLSTLAGEDGHIVITKEIIGECVQEKHVHYDKKGDHHYNIISAFQKSIRGSDVDAALHYLARLIEVGDLSIICRRLLVTAWEDIGLANPNAASNVLHAIMSAERLGLPEARIPLAVAVTELCLSPKSNSAYKALDQALSDVRNMPIGEVPDHLKDSHYSGAKERGHGKGYLYPHDFGGWVYQEYVPEQLREKRYYEPRHVGQEKRFAERYERIEQLKEQKRRN